MVADGFSGFAPEIVAALADDAHTLALLHDQELTAPLIDELRAIDFPRNLMLLPVGRQAREAWQFMEAALRDVPHPVGAETLDGLAADYASIYLVSSYGASPCESTWIDEDHLLCQDTMFQLREIYRVAGLAAADWRRRPDDHLVLQLAFLAHAMRHATTRDDWRHLAKTIDEHLLRWLPDFARRIAAHCETAMYAGIAMVTHEWVDGLRQIFAEQLNEPRPTREEIEARLKPAASPVPVPVTFVPGVGPTI